MKQKISSFINWAGSLGHRPDDKVELKALKSIVTITIYAVIGNLLYFYYLYHSMGRRMVALSLLIYAIFFIISLILFRIHRNFKIIRDSSFIGIYLYIITYHTLLGGYIGSSGYINYGIAALIGIHIFYEKGQKLIWFFLYIITAIVLYFLEPTISQGVEILPVSFRRLAFANDFVLMSCMVFLSIRYFTNKIRDEKAKSDVLIHSILPESVVEELKTKGKSDPIHVNYATILFIDFVNFTRMTDGMSPEKLVSTLNEHFIRFDSILDKHNVEKLKTIGDGYMAVGGLPEINNTHPVDVALVAFEILNYLEEWNAHHEDSWEIRIGIHSGSMVAGIIGKSKFSYDVWGSSVNLSSRLETSSHAGQINVSKQFIDSCGDFFEFEPRGFVDIKNIGSVEMFFLKDIKASLRSGRYQPNAEFDKLYNAYSQISINEPNLNYL